MGAIPHSGEFINPPDHTQIKLEYHRDYAKRYSHEFFMSDKVGYIAPDGKIISAAFDFNGFNHNIYGVSKALPLIGDFFDYYFHQYHGLDSKEWLEKEQHKSGDYIFNSCLLPAGKSLGEWQSRLKTRLDDRDIKEDIFKELEEVEKFYKALTGDVVAEQSLHYDQKYTFNDIVGSDIHTMQEQEFIIQRDIASFLKPIFTSSLNIRDALGGIDEGWCPNYNPDIHPVTKPLDERRKEAKEKAYYNRVAPTEIYSQPIKTILVQAMGYDAIERPNKTITTSHKNIHERFYDYLLMDWEIQQLPRFIWDNQAEKYIKKEIPEVSWKELDLQAELQDLKRSIPLFERYNFFKNPRSKQKDLAQVAIKLSQDDTYIWSQPLDSLESM